MYAQGKDRSALPPAAEGKELEAMHSSMHGQTDNEFSFDAGIQKELSPVTNFTPNKFGIRIEDDILIRKNRPQILTTVGKGLRRV